MFKSLMRGATLRDNLSLVTAILGEAVRKVLGTGPPGSLQVCDFDVILPSIGRFRVRRLTDDFNQLFFFNYFWEREVIRFIRNNLAKGDLFIDVGAHIGFYTIMAGRMIGSSGRVIAIEPNPYTFGALTTNIRLNRLNNVTVLNVAASDKRGYAALWAGKYYTSSSSLHEDWVEGLNVLHFSNLLRVPTIKLDDLIEAYGLGSLHGKIVMKIDVEGHELSVLKGGQKLLGLVDSLVLETTRERVVFSGRCWVIRG